jgi:hypothetical protein
MKKYLVDLADEERAALQALIRRGKTQARKVTRARTLLRASQGATDSEIVTALGVGLATVERTPSPLGKSRSPAGGRSLQRGPCRA